MIEKVLEDRMRAALAGEPPLGFDPDEVVDRAVRHTRRRTAILTLGATAAVVVLAVGAAVVTGAGGDDGRVADTPTATVGGKVCQGTPAGAIAPPGGFPGSDAIVDRLRDAEPGLLVEHVPGTSFDPPMGEDVTAFDCPPYVSMSRWVSGGGEQFGLDLIHRRARLDLAGDPFADDVFSRLVAETPAAGGARIRVYRNSTNRDQDKLAVVRFGSDGMITAASLIGADGLTITQAELTALVNDPELRFELPR